MYTKREFVWHFVTVSVCVCMCVCVQHTCIYACSRIFAGPILINKLFRASLSNDRNLLTCG